MNALAETGDPDTELHGHEIFHGMGAWEALAPRLRISLYQQAMRAVGAHDVKIFISGVEEAGLTRRYGPAAWHPHDVTLRYLLERVDAFADACGEPALIIADDLGRLPTPDHRYDSLRAK